MKEYIIASLIVPCAALCALIVLGGAFALGLYWCHHPYGLKRR